MGDDGYSVYVWDCSKYRDGDNEYYWRYGDADNEEIFDEHLDEVTLEFRNRKRLRELCQSIRKNDPSFTVVKPDGYPKDYSGELGQALAENTNVTDLHLDLHKLCQDGVQGVCLQQLRDRTTLQKAGFDVGLCKFLRIRDDNGVIKMCFDAIVDNSNIQELLIPAGVPSNDISSLIQTKGTLHTLAINLPEYDTDERTTVGAAFKANKSLERLSVLYGSHSGTVDVVLLELKSHARLRELELLCGSRADAASQMEALAQCLTGTVPLSKLRLTGYRLGIDPLKCLLAGIRSCPSLEKLALENCRLTNDSVYKELVPFMEIHRDTCSVREFSLDGSYQEHSNREPSSENIAGDLFFHPMATIGSSLQSLALNNGFAGGFWDSMLKHGNTVQLEHLSFGSSDRDDWHKMLRCLPKLRYLQRLELRDINEWIGRDFSYSTCWPKKVGNPKHGILKAVRQNGSLHKISFFMFVGDDAPCQNDEVYDTPTLRAYLERNAKLPTLLSKVEKGPGMGGVHRTDVPNLMLAGMPAEQTAFSNVLKGLLALGDSIDQSSGRGNKRLIPR